MYFKILDISSELAENKFFFILMKIQLIRFKKWGQYFSFYFNYFFSKTKNKSTILEISKSDFLKFRYPEKATSLVTVC